MSNISYILWLLLCIVMQGLLFSHLSLYGAVILIYLIALLKMPTNWNHSLQIVAGFLTGLLVDIFCNTPGMHAFCATTLMLIRLPFISTHVIEQTDDEKKMIGAFGACRVPLSKYSAYAAIFIVGYSLMLYLIESFSLFNGLMLLSKVLLGSILTFLVAFAIEMVTLKK